jgi:hypothetical protein
MCHHHGGKLFACSFEFEFEFDHCESKVEKQIAKRHPQRIFFSFVDLNEAI